MFPFSNRQIIVIDQIIAEGRYTLAIFTKREHSSRTQYQNSLTPDTYHHRLIDKYNTQNPIICFVFLIKFLRLYSIVTSGQVDVRNQQ